MWPTQDRTTNASLNRGIERAAPEAAARAYFTRYYRPIGQLQRPLITLHTRYSINGSRRRLIECGFARLSVWDWALTPQSLPPLFRATDIRATLYKDASFGTVHALVVGWTDTSSFFVGVVYS